MPIRVILADDHVVVRDGLRLILETKKNVEVVAEASDGRQAVDQVRRLKPDVIVMDISMPEMNGIEATRQIKATMPLTRVIILSMHADSEYILRALRAGATGYLLKESAGEEVLEAVRSVSAGKRYLSPRVVNTVVNGYIEQNISDQTVCPVDRLSNREREILQLVVEGKSSQEIADALFLSIKTVETYRSRLMQKLEIRNLPELVKFAIRHGLTKLD